ncbi:MAG: tetratricopeptide repeat protein [Myxococcota bacterium]
MSRGTERKRTHAPLSAALALALASFGCATSASRSSAPVETRDSGGFSITETTRIPAGARGDFESANEALARGDLADAIARLEDLTRRAPRLTAPRINLGIARARDGDLAAAESDLRAALALNPKHPVARNELGIVYRRMGRFAEARKAFESTLTSHPDFHPARRNLAILCDLYLADTVCALESYELYRAAVPDDEKVEMWLADLRNRIGG